MIKNIQTIKNKIKHKYLLNLMLHDNCLPFFEKLKPKMVS